MHLSLLSDCFVSDRIDDAGSTDHLPTAGEAHRDGVLRGLVLLAVLAALIAIGCLSTAIHTAPAEPVAFASQASFPSPTASPTLRAHATRTAS